MNVKWKKKKYKNRKKQKGYNGPHVCVCVIAPVTMSNVRAAATALLGSGAADALSDAFDNGFI